MLDFDETGLYKGFVRNVDGQKHPGKDPKLLRLSDVRKYDTFSGVMQPNTVLFDADEENHNRIFQEIIKGEGIACYMTDREGGRGIHALMINSNTALKKADKVMLACGVVADFHPGYSLPYECLKFDGVERRPIYDKHPYQDMPKYFTPLPKINIDFANLGEGDGRNSTLFSYILSLQNAGFSEDDIKGTIRIINQYVLAEPLEERELDVILRDEAFKKQVFFQKNTFSHDKFAERIRVQHHIKKINGQLHIYQNGVYIPDNRCIERAMLQEVSSLTARQRSEVMKYLDIVCETESTSGNLHLTAFKNGIYNMNTDQLEAFSPEHIITNPVPWNYNPGAKSALVDGVLDKVSDGDVSIRNLLEELAGSCLYRSAKLGGGKAGILTGGRDNGKSTFLDMIKAMLGSSNFSTVDFKDLDSKFKTAELAGKLANIGDDISDSYNNDLAVFKKLVTGNEVNVERKGQDPFDLTPYATLIFSANDVPRMKDPTGAALRRLMLIPFTRKFSNTDPDYDPDISYKLAQPEHMEYFIQCALDGLADVLDRRRFTVPAKAEQQKAEYEVENNPILSFVEEVGKNSIINEATSDVYARYKVFCNDSGFQPGSNLTFSKCINRVLGTKVIPMRKGKKVYKAFVTDK